VMLQKLRRIAKCVNLPRVENRTQGFTHIFLFPMHLRNS